jgi:hypothetical protein
VEDGHPVWAGGTLRGIDTILPGNEEDRELGKLRPSRRLRAAAQVMGEPPVTPRTSEVM